MLVIAIAFLYISVLAYSYGNAFTVMAERLTGYRIKLFTSFLWAGCIIFTVYAQVYSLFSGVGLVANLILLALGIVFDFVFRQRLKENISRHLTVRKVIGFIVLTLLFAYGTSRGYSHYDTALYHAQAIRWVEEYGVVRGLGLLHNRLAYNSAAFPLSALFSFWFIDGMDSMHEMAGFFSFLLSLELLDLGHIFKDKKLLLSDVFRVGIFYYLTLVFDEIVSPASDYFLMTVVFYLLLLWIKLFETKEKDGVPYAWVCVVGVFACTIKFSACFIILLTLYPVWLFIKAKKYGKIGLFLGTGFLVAVPFFIRNVIISGRLLYPSTALDFFNVSWKIPADAANFDRMEIIAWGRGFHSVEGFYSKFTEWFPAYFAGQTMMVKAMFALDVLGLIIAVLFSAYYFCKKKRENYLWSFLVCVIYVCFFIWLNTSPLVRYGYVYLICPFVTVFGYLGLKKRIATYVLAGGCLLFILWKGSGLAIYCYNAGKSECYIYQQAYEQFEVEAISVGNEIIYIPKEGDRTGYYYFPSTPNLNCELYGDSFREGFKPKD